MARHLEPHGETIGLFVDGYNSRGEGKERGIYVYNASIPSYFSGASIPTYFNNAPIPSY